LGITPALGRAFVAADDRPGAAPVVLLSQGFWQREFGGRPDVIGRTLEMNTISYTVVGVLSDMSPWPRANEVWIPMGVDAVMTHESAAMRFAGGLIHEVVARLAPGVDLQQARGDADRIAGQLTASHPDVYGAGGYEIGVRPLRETLVGEAAPSFILLLALTLLVVLIASANVANLNLAQLAGRRQELFVRYAVGAEPGRIRRQ